MSTIAQDIVTLAVLRSQLNDASLVPAPIIFKAMSIYERQVFFRAAQIDPEYFGTNADTSTRVLFTDSWNISVVPGNIAAITKAVVKTVIGSFSGVVAGTVINLVKMRFPDVEVAPRAFVRGRMLTGYGTELGSDSFNIVTKVTLYYASLPAVITSGSSVMTIPDEWLDLVVLPIARLMCLRDRRPDDAQIIDAEFKEVVAMFEQAVMIYDHGAARPLPSIPPLAALMASGGGRPNA